MNEISNDSRSSLMVEDWGQLHISILWLYRGPIPRASQGFQASYPCQAAWLVLSGEVRVSHDEKTVVARAGEWLFPKPVARVQEFSDDAEIISLRWHMEWPDGKQLFEERLSVVLPASRFPDLRKRIDELQAKVESATGQSFQDRQFSNHRVSLCDYLEIEQALFAWARTMIDCLVSAGVPLQLQRFEDERLTRAINLLNSWPLMEPFSEKLFYQKVRLSRSQLERLFREKMSLTPKQYFDRRRLRYAERCLHTGSKSVKEIAFESGFKHLSSFSGWYKQKTGTSPIEARLAPPAY